MAAGEARSKGGVCEDTVRSLDSFFSQFAPVMWLAGKLGAEPWVVGATSLMWIAGFLLWGFTGELLCKVIGLLYPMYASFRALEDTEHDEVIEWMLYWIVYAAVTLVESIFHGLLVWVPFYHVGRLLFAVWLFTPSTRGCRSIYGWILAPVLRRYRPTIDAALAKSSEELQGNKWSKELRSRLSSAMQAAKADNSEAEKSINDLVAEELAKVAATQMSNLASRAFAGGQPADGQSHVGAKRRTASPRPSLSKAPSAE